MVGTFKQSLLKRTLLDLAESFHIYTVDVRKCFLKYPHIALVSIAVLWIWYVIYKYVFPVLFTCMYITEQCPVPKLSEEEKRLLVFSWNQVERDADRIGAVTFMK